MTNITFTKHLECLMRRFDSEGIVYHYHQSLLSSDKGVDKEALRLVKDMRLASLSFEIPLPSSADETKPLRHRCYIYWLGKGKTAYKPIFRYYPYSLGKAIELTEYTEILNMLSYLSDRLKQEQAKLASFSC